MELTPLNALSPLDGRYGARSVPLRPLLSELGLIRHRVLVEVRWLQALAAEPAIPDLGPFDAGTIRLLDALVDGFGEPEARRVKEIERTTNHDVKAVEYYLAGRCGSHPSLAAARSFLHFACTSEDISNLAYGIALGTARDQLLLPHMDRLVATLAELAERHAADAMLARTHGQPASPTTLGKEMAVFADRLWRARNSLAAVQIRGKLNGAVGNYNAHCAAYPEVDWPALARRFVESLGLAWSPVTTQIEPHDAVAEMLHAVQRFDVVLVDLCRDLWGYIALGYLRSRPREGEVGSSTMPHKVNPIDFENAEGNLGLANAILGHLAEKLPVSRWQRDLTDSTVLRNLGVALGYALVAWQSCLAGLGKIDVDRAALDRDLDGAWEVLAEPVQTVMRKYRIEDAYEQLKTLTRGRRIDRDSLHAFIRELAIGEQDRHRLLALTPRDYVGRAAEIARSVARSVAPATTPAPTPEAVSE